MTLVLRWLLLCCLTCWGLTAQAAPATVDVDPLGEQAVWLAPQAWMVRDAPGLETAILVSRDAPWTPAPGVPILDFGVDTSAHWVWVRLHNPGPEAVRRVLEVAEPLYDHLAFWVQDAYDRRLLAHARMGDRMPFSDRPVAYRHPLMPLEIESGQTVDILLRAEAIDGEHDPLPLRLWTPEAFQQQALLETLIYGAYYGAIVVLLLYNLLLFTGTRDRSFLWYALFLGSFVLWNLTFRGYAYQYLWPDRSTWNAMAIVWFSVGIYSLLPVFSWSLLEMPQRTPWLVRAQAVLIVLASAHGIWITLDPKAGVFATLDLIGPLMFLLLMISAVRIGRQGQRVAWIYLASCGALFAGALLYYLAAFEIIAPSLLTIYALNLGSAAEFLLLALALAYRINRLEALASIDTLTGLQNRRRFQQALSGELARARRQTSRVGLLMVDVDAFKVLNDMAGHPRGDEVLRALGDLLRRHLRRATDQAFRVGGEEFVLMAPCEDPQGLESWGESVRQAVEQAAWAHPDPERQRVTVSVGVTWSSLHDTPETLYQRVDQALYQAKREGRNRVAVIAPA